MRQPVTVSKIGNARAKLHRRQKASMNRENLISVSHRDLVAVFAPSITCHAICTTMLENFRALRRFFANQSGIYSRQDAKNAK
jgi:hypothetical protein